MDCKLVPYGEEERRCVKCGYITWNNEKSDKEIIDDMIAAGYPAPNCRENTTKCECGANTSCQCGPEEPKQETLEEAAKRYATDMSGTYYEDLYNAFINGAKWQKEQFDKLDIFFEGVKWQQEQDKKRYSVEEVENILIEYVKTNPTKPYRVLSWFGQIKK